MFTINGASDEYGQIGQFTIDSKGNMQSSSETMIETQEGAELTATVTRVVVNER